MITLAFDPGTLFSGWSIFTDGQPTTANNIRLSQKYNLSVRLGRLFVATSDLVKEVKPDLILVEEQHVGANRKTSLITARAMGIIIAAAGIATIPVMTYSPCEIKKAATGKGNATKEEVAHALLSLYPKCQCLTNIGEFTDKGAHKTDDIFDAIAINHAHKILKSGKLI